MIARISTEESACGECRCERPADRAASAESAGAGVLREAFVVIVLPGRYLSAAARSCGVTVGKWRRRFLKDRCDGLLDEARPGRPRTISDDQVAAVIERTLQTTPADATHWSIRSMAAETGFSHTTIRRMWSAFGLQPHQERPVRVERRVVVAAYEGQGRLTCAQSLAGRQRHGRWLQ
jgi:transposase